MRQIGIFILWSLRFNSQKGDSQHTHKKWASGANGQELHLRTAPPGGGRVPWAMKPEIRGGRFAKIRLCSGFKFYRFTITDFSFSYLFEILTEVATCKQAENIFNSSLKGFYKWKVLLPLSLQSFKVLFLTDTLKQNYWLPLMLL